MGKNSLFLIRNITNMFFEIIDYFDINENYKKLVELRTKKFEMKLKDFLEKEDKIIEDIIKDSSSIDVAKFFKC